MDKPVSEPTAPAEPLSAFEQNFPHWSDCARHNEPAYPAESCDCGMDQIMKDAERYRWLRNEHAKRGPSWHVRQTDCGVVEIDLDAAIDAAMKG